MTIEICPKCKGPISPIMRNCTRGCGYEAPPLALAPLIIPGIPASAGDWQGAKPAPVSQLGITLPPLAVAQLPPLIKPREARESKVVLKLSPLDAIAPARVLLVDFPWAFADKGVAGNRGAEQQYKVMSIDEMKAFPLPSLADNCVGFFWRIEALGKACYEVVEALGFVPKSKLTWIKTKPCEACKGRGYIERLDLAVPDLQLWCAACRGRGSLPQMGLGHYTRRSTEDLIIAVNKKCKKPSVCHPEVKSILDWLEAPRTFHSAKPDEIYEIIEKMYPQGPYVELFARRRRKGWIQYGDELPPEVMP